MNDDLEKSVFPDASREPINPNSQPEDQFVSSEEAITPEGSTQSPVEPVDVVQNVVEPVSNSVNPGPVEVPVAEPQPMTDSVQVSTSGANNTNQVEMSSFYNMPNGGATQLAGTGFNGILQDRKKLLMIGGGVLLVIIIFVWILASKTLTCTYDEEMFDVKISGTIKTKFWFNEATSVSTEMIIDYSDVDDDYKKEMRKSLLEQYEEEDEYEDYKVKEDGEIITITYKEEVDEDEYGRDYTYVKNTMEDLDFICK